MKRIMALLILMAMVVLSVVPAQAATPGTATVTTASSLNRGDSVTVTVALSGAPVLQAVMVLPVYDQTAFELTDFRFSKTGKVTDFNGTDGVILWQNPTSPNGELVTFTLTAKKNAPYATYTVGCKVTARDAQDDLLELQTQSASLTVRNYIPGDVDRDGDKDTDDAVYLLLNELFGNGNYPVDQNMNLDFDGSGGRSTDDAVYLLLNVLFGDKIYPLKA